MRKLRKAAALALIAATAISAASCGGGGRQQGAAGGTTAATSADPNNTTTPAQTNDTDENVQAAVQEVDVDTTIKVEKKLKWLSWWKIDETSATCELFKAKYGIPEEGDASYGDAANDIFVFTNVAYADRYDKLGQMVSSGDSPDMFEFEICYFPLSAYKGMFKSIDGVIDTNTPEWSATRKDMDKFMWGGKNYCAITDVNINGMWWYKKSTITEAGFDDPYTLYKEGKWDWNAFLDMADKFQQMGENKFAVDGWSVSEDLVATTGKPLVSIENGILVYNGMTAEIERGMALAEKLCSENYRYDRATLNSWQINYDAWANGDTLFFDEGPWFWTDKMWKYKKKYEWADDEVWCVPAPRDPSADAYYQAMKQDAYMWCGGSTNEAGFKAWTECVLATSKDESVKQAQREKDKRDYLYTDQMLDLYEEFKHDLVAVWDFKNGISTAAANTSSMEASPVESLLKIPYVTGSESFLQLRSEKDGEITTAIEEMNSSVS